jgi:AcrR family transcriptional regulator
MTSKSALKREHIIRTARSLFCKRGYSSITMKDIVEACGISRGGLYLYFDSTHDIFLEVLKQAEQEEDGFNDDFYDVAANSENSAAKVIGFFLKAQRREILKKEDSLAVATYEFFFENKESRKDNPIRNTYEDMVVMLTDLIERGVADGELYEVDAAAAARNLMFVIEGMKVTARTMELDQQMVDQQLMYIVDTLIPA